MMCPACEAEIDRCWRWCPECGAHIVVDLVLMGASGGPADDGYSVEWMLGGQPEPVGGSE